MKRYGPRFCGGNRSNCRVSKKMRECRWRIFPMNDNWFEVDRAGLKQLLERRGKGFAVCELVQNAWDQAVTRVEIEIGRPQAGASRLRVTDNDPGGFRDLREAYTLFAHSAKKSNPIQRGRFNLGEKLVLAICRRAEISSTTGTLTFAGKQRRFSSSQKAAAGTVFTAEIPLTIEEYEAMLATVRSLLPPAGIETSLNGKVLPARPLVRIVETTLPTEISDGTGNLRPTRRKTVIELFEPLPGAAAWLYEMGIPVVETGDRWHCNLLQKVPLGFDRDNVTPAYLAAVRTAVFNATHDLLTPDDSTAAWAETAINSKDCAPAAARRFADLRFGPKRVSFDPSDPEANKIAVSEGFSVITGSMLSKAAWRNLREASAIAPAGQVTPSPKPYHPDGEPLNLIAEADWTAAQRKVVAYVRAVCPHLIGRVPEVLLTSDSGWPFAATFGPKAPLVFNVARAGLFGTPDRSAVNRLLIHELGHDASPDHLSDAFYHALCRLGAALADAYARYPELAGMLEG